MKSLKSLKEPEGVPIGKPFTITFAVHLGDSAGDKELKNATKKESTEAVTKHFIEKSIPANAFLLGEGFKKISVLGLVTTLAVQPYKV